MIFDTSAGAFSVVNVNTVSSAGAAPSGWSCPELLRPGARIRTQLTGHANAPGSTPTGWFGGFAGVMGD